MGKRSRRSAKKPRNTWTYARSDGETDVLGLTFDARTGRVRFEGELRPTYVQTSYDRPKGEKVVTRVPLVEEWVPTATNHALGDFDVVFAVDTNTRRGRSATGLVQGHKVAHPEDDTPAIEWQVSDRSFYFEGAEVGDAERIGWVLAIEEIERKLAPAGGSRVGLIVDHALGQHEEINARREAILAERKLSLGFKLVYGSSGVGGSIASAMMKRADLAATMILDLVERRRAPPKMQLHHDLAGIRVANVTIEIRTPPQGLVGVPPPGHEKA